MRRISHTTGWSIENEDNEGPFSFISHPNLTHHAIHSLYLFAPHNYLKLSLDPHAYVPEQYQEGHSSRNIIRKVIGHGTLSGRA